MASRQVEQLVASVREDLRAAQLSRDRRAMSLLPEILSIADSAGTIEPRQGVDYTGAAATEVPRREVTVTEVRALLRASVAERIEAADAYRDVNEHDRAAQLQAEAAVISGYLDPPRSRRGMRSQSGALCRPGVRFRDDAGPLEATALAVSHCYRGPAWTATPGCLGANKRPTARLGWDGQVIAGMPPSARSRWGRLSCRWLRSRR